jgi:hypothetical protein
MKTVKKPKQPQPPVRQHSSPVGRMASPQRRIAVPMSFRIPLQ